MVLVKFPQRRRNLWCILSKNTREKGKGLCRRHFWHFCDCIICRCSRREETGTQWAARYCAPAVPLRQRRVIMPSLYSTRSGLRTAHMVNNSILLCRDAGYCNSAMIPVAVSQCCPLANQFVLFSMTPMYIVLSRLDYDTVWLLVFRSRK